MRYHFFIGLILLTHAQQIVIANPDTDPLKLLRELKLTEDIQNKYLEILSILHNLENKPERKIPIIPDGKKISMKLDLQEQPVKGIKRKRTMSLTGKIMRLWKGNRS